MPWGRKGVFFTLTSILLISVLFIWYNQKQYVSNIDQIPVTTERINKANDFVRNINSHYISTFSSVSTSAALSGIAD